METIYALVIIFSGAVAPSDDANPDILSGTVENKTTVYFRTMEACQEARKAAFENQELLVTPGMDVSLEIRECEGIQVVE